MLAIKLQDSILERLTALAEKTGKTKSFYAREAILNYLDDLEDYYLCENVSQEIKSGKMPTYSLEEVEQKLGLAN